MAVHRIASPVHWRWSYCCLTLKHRFININIAEVSSWYKSHMIAWRKYFLKIKTVASLVHWQWRYCCLTLKHRFNNINMIQKSHGCMKETFSKYLEWKSSIMFTVPTDSIAVESMVHVINSRIYYTWELSVSLNSRQGYKIIAYCMWSVSRSWQQHNFTYGIFRNQESGILYFRQTTRCNKQNIKGNTVQAYLVRQSKSNIRN